MMYRFKYLDYLSMNMKPVYLILSVVILGLAVLFFFPEPETNYLAYVGTASFFLAVVIFLLIRGRRKP